MTELSRNEKILFDACHEIGVELSTDMLRKFKRYFRLLVEWNEKINLTTITEEDDVYLKHFADSIYGAGQIEKNSTVCDIGTGAGFPGVVLAIIRPDLKVVLVDSLNKRVEFLNQLIAELELKNTLTLHNRAEDDSFKEKYLNKFNVVTARAVARLVTLTEYCLPFVKVGGKMLAYKSDRIEEELQESLPAMKEMGSRRHDIISYNLSEEIIRTIVVINKSVECSKKYPRNQNKPKNSPIL